MADYVPIISDDDLSYTAQASASITGGQVLVVTGVGTVGPAGAAATNVVGVASKDAVTGDYLTVYRGGVQLLTASGTVTAGDMVTSAAAGAVITAATPAVGAFIGNATTTATTGVKVRILWRA